MNALHPEERSSFKVHYCQNEDVVRIFSEQDSEREFPDQTSSDTIDVNLMHFRSGKNVFKRKVKLFQKSFAQTR